MRDAGEKALRFQLLIYGCFSTDCDSPSWQRFGQGAGLSQSQMKWIWETYLERPEQRDDWRAAPLVADLGGVAPAHLIVGSLDPLLDDSNMLAAKLKAADVPHDLTVYQGINHGFVRYGRLIGTARRAISECAAALVCVGSGGVGVVPGGTGGVSSGTSGGAPAPGGAGISTGITGASPDGFADSGGAARGATELGDV
jgi:acetyl esterase/lipase